MSKACKKDGILAIAIEGLVKSAPAGLVAVVPKEAFMVLLELFIFNMGMDGVPKFDFGTFVVGSC